MRLLVLSVSALCVACLGATCATSAIAQTGQWGQAEDQIPPYLTHMDRRHGHDHVYPDRGAVVRDVPQGAIAVNYAGISYRFVGGVWYQRVGPAYVVVAPPIGLIVPQLPAFATSFDSAGKNYVYANDVFYRPRPDLGGYEVVNDPEDLIPERARVPSGTAPVRLASAAPNVPQAGAQSIVQPATQPATQAAIQPPAQPAIQRQAQPAIQPLAQPTTIAASPTAAAAVPSNESQAPANPNPAAAPSSESQAPASPAAAPSTEAQAPANPTAAPSSEAPPPPNPTGVAIYPRNGQSLDQQAMDRYECYRFAVGQTGFDPLASNGNTPPAEVARRDADYSRAQAACLAGRGYGMQ